MMKTNAKRKNSAVKKLIPAAGMLALSASMLATSTYAWFSMNKSVNVTGFEIQAKSNNTFLLIGEDSKNTADLIQAQTGDDLTSEVVTMASGESSVYPSSPILPAYVSDSATTNAAAHKYFATGTVVVSNLSTAATPANWFTAQNNDPANSNNSVKNVNVLNATDSEASTLYDFSDYVIKRTFYLTLADGSDTAHQLKVTPTIALKSGQSEGVTDISAVKVLVAVGSNYQILSTSTSGAQSLYSTADFNITDTTATQVDVYVYYDGEESAVYTNNKPSLAAATVDLAFGVELGSAS
jgi:hypothetical protein